MTEELDIFNFNEKEVRIHRDKNGKPWFVAADVCRYFGETNRNRAMRHVDTEDKEGTQINTRGGVQTVTVINESGLYSLLLGMQPQKARGVTADYIKARQEKIDAFRRWVTHEVLPSIRKTGGYIVAKPDESPEEIMARAQKIADDVLKRREESDRISSSILYSVFKGGDTNRRMR